MQGRRIQFWMSGMDGTLSERMGTQRTMLWQQPQCDEGRRQQVDIHAPRINQAATWLSRGNPALACKLLTELDVTSIMAATRPSCVPSVANRLVVMELICTILDIRTDLSTIFRLP
ncbi:hypothetical protein PISMIDRAFT_344965 [Pisolithus microcarpus 441]|uniref:Uncharacterized protein n=1 Tax=Pisolithus microcarpus 441 TaxID=765257 RepID=A0A0C9YX23_9AGAM|nr:hypothetical protein PISMIDRAFT_344965 [Pisolithus microcarpus 441]